MKSGKGIVPVGQDKTNIVARRSRNGAAGSLDGGQRMGWPARHEEENPPSSLRSSNPAPSMPGGRVVHDASRLRVS
jgi:hypothetical protein